MINTKTKKDLLENILATKDFKSSNIYKKLLIYLVDSSINNIKLKEYLLAIDVFEKSSDFNPSEDSSVRVYVSNLRKKLDHYYATEGRDDKYRIEIPKGHYDLQFAPNVSSKNLRTISFSWKKLTYTLLPILLLLIGFSIYSTIKLNSINRYEISNTLQNPIWENLTDVNVPNLLVLGNDLFFLEKLDNEQTIVRKHYINTVKEFEYYKSINPEKKINRITDYAFFPYINISIIPTISNTIFSNSKYNLKYSSEINGNDLLQNNIIFFGSFRNLHFLDFLIKESSIEFSSDPENMYIKLHEQDTTITSDQIGPPDVEHVDYCLFRKIRGPNNNTIYMFVSFYESGLYSATKYMVNEENLDILTKMFQDKYGEMPNYFDVLFKSSGYSRTALTSSIEFIHKTE